MKFSDDDNPFEVDPALKLADQLPMRRSVARAISVALAVALIASGTLVGLAQVRHRQRPRTIAMVPRNTEPSPTPSDEPTDVLFPPVEAEELPSSELSDEPANSPVDCHNSTDKRCGDFYWITQPGSNAPVKVSIVVATPDPTAGEPVTFVVTVSDQDAPNIQVWDTPNWGEHNAVVGFALCLQDPHGGWTPPPKRPGKERFVFTHTYDEPGTYGFWIGGKSDSGEPWQTRCRVADPYESEDDASLRFVVGPAPTESPSPTPTPTETPTPTPTES